MNLPSINNKMKNIPKDNKILTPNSLGNDGFGLGIQVFKIQSLKNNDQNRKSKQRNIMQNIQKPQNTTKKTIPISSKPKKLPSLDISINSQSVKDRPFTYVNSKTQTLSQTGYSEKNHKNSDIQQIHSSFTPGPSFLTRKSTSSSKQKQLKGFIRSPIITTSTKNFAKENSSIEGRKNTVSRQKIKHYKMGQKVPSKKGHPFAVKRPTKSAPTFIPHNKLQQGTLQYRDYHKEHNVLLDFYVAYDKAMIQHNKEIKQLRNKLITNSTTINSGKIEQMDEQVTQKIYEKIQQFESRQSLIQTVLNMKDQQRFERNRQQGQKQKKSKKNINIVVPVEGFEYDSEDQFDWNPITDYVVGNRENEYRGEFIARDYMRQNMEARVIVDKKLQNSSDSESQQQKQQ